MTRRRSTAPLVVLFLLFAGPPAGAAGVTWPDVSESRSTMAAEFDPQRAVVVAWDAGDVQTREVLARLVKALGGDVDSVVLVADEEHMRDAVRAFRDAGIRRIPSFVELPYDTIWARDYGPLAVTTRTGECLVDTIYGGIDRPRDDRVPERLANAMGWPVRRSPLVLEGGNLLTNGRGTFLTTYSTTALNGFGTGGEDAVSVQLGEHLGASQVVFLEPLIGEPTSHVDMFATFVSPTTVVVGRYDAADDPVNAAVLDRNARALAGLVTPAGKLEVVRIPMPASDGNRWYTYTNVVFANRRLLVPVYEELDDDDRREALETYRRLLPEWRVEAVESTPLIDLGGGLHCVTSNIPSPLPRGGRAATVPQVVLGGDGGRAWREWKTAEAEGELTPPANWDDGGEPAFPTHDWDPSLPRRVFPISGSVPGGARLPFDWDPSESESESRYESRSSRSTRRPDRLNERRALLERFESSRRVEP